MRRIHTMTIVNQSARVTTEEAQAIVDALDQRMPLLARVWELRPPTVTFNAPSADYHLTIIDEPDQPGALGYHSEDGQGGVYGFVFANPVLDNGGAVLTGADYTVAAVTAHEVFETICDPNVNRWCQDGNGDLWALEVCDPVQGLVRTIDTSHGPVNTSAFVSPHWFDPGRPGAFTIDPTGYAVKWDSTGIHDVMGETVPEWRKQARLRSTIRKGFGAAS